VALQIGKRKHVGFKCAMTLRVSKCKTFINIITLSASVRQACIYNPVI
jgi:hypothetical protein